MLREIIGERNVDGTERIPPVPNGNAQIAMIEELRQRGELIKLKTRDLDELGQMPTDMVRPVELQLGQIRGGESVAISVSRRLVGGPRDHLKRQQTIARQFPVGRVFEVAVDVALKILRQPYDVLFEEVCDESPDTPPPPAVAPPKPGARKR